MTRITDWANEIINRDGRCVICGQRQGLEAHHVFHVHPQDKIYYDTNNGVTLCKGCHDKYHEQYGVECSVKNLLALQRLVGDSKVKELKSKNKRLKRVVKNLRKTLEAETDD